MIKAVGVVVLKLCFKAVLNWIVSILSEDEIHYYSMLLLICELDESYVCMTEHLYV